MSYLSHNYITQIVTPLNELPSTSVTISDHEITRGNAVINQGIRYKTISSDVKLSNVIEASFITNF